MLKICKYCDEEFNSRINKTYCCKKEECVKQKNSEKYKLKQYNISCIVCNIDFKGTKRSLICSDSCKEKYNIKDIEITQKINCKRCSSFIKNKTVFTNIYGKNTVAKEKNNRVCKLCTEESRANFSERQKGENNTNWKEVKKIRKAKYTVEERKEIMSLFNPMKNEQSKLKMVKTIKEKYEKGELIRPLGRLSPLWKGNRKKSFTIRDRIGWWKKENLKRAGYKCENCGNNRKLEVHHQDTPFRDILSNVLNGRILDDLNLDDFEILCDQISEIHKNEKGLVVCKKCHSDIDEFRKI